jgi:hypothetical protein
MWLAVAFIYPPSSPTRPTAGPLRAQAPNSRSLAAAIRPAASQQSRNLPLLASTCWAAVWGLGQRPCLAGLAAEVRLCYNAGDERADWGGVGCTGLPAGRVISLVNDAQLKCCVVVLENDERHHA